MERVEENHAECDPKSVRQCYAESCAKIRRDSSSVRSTTAARGDALAFVRTVIALIAQAHNIARPHVGVADHAPAYVSRRTRIPPLRFSNTYRPPVSEPTTFLRFLEKVEYAKGCQKTTMKTDQT